MLDNFKNREEIRDDWRIMKGHEEEYIKMYSRIELLKVIFPEFWQNAYKTKNNFFQQVLGEAKYIVELGAADKQWLKDNPDWLTTDKCQYFWQAHCNFCNKSIVTHMNEEVYLSKDNRDWVCTTCFNDFKEYFKWSVIGNAKDIS